MCEYTNAHSSNNTHKHTAHSVLRSQQASHFVTRTTNARTHMYWYLYYREHA